MSKIIRPGVAVQRVKRLTGNRADDLTGREFDRLRVLSLYGIRATGRRTKTYFWLCSCKCGMRIVVNRNNLVTGHARSCGCLSREAMIRRNYKHGMSRTAEFRIWAGMLNRCYDPGSFSYKDYGARGIGVCKRWRDPDHGFKNFYADMGRRPAGLSLDRIDFNRHYSPSNCRWATATQQARNTRANTRLTLDGRTQCLSAWAEELGIDSSTLLGRLSVWSLRRALTTRKMTA